MEDLKYIPIRQPFYVLSSERYLKHTMNRFGIVHFFQFTAAAPYITAVPDGCVEMVFCCSDTPHAFICGTFTETGRIPVETGKLYFGVRFLPGYNPILGVKAMDRLIGSCVPFEELIDDPKMLNNIFGADSFSHRIDAFMRFYMSIFDRIHPMDKSNLIVRHSINMIFERKGNVNVQELSDETGYSTRYINQCFRTELSMSPKVFIRMIRFQSSLDILHSVPKLTLTETSSILGYFDQAHFIKEFKAFSGFTPKKYLKYLETNNYSSLIEIV